LKSQVFELKLELEETKRVNDSLKGSISKQEHLLVEYANKNMNFLSKK
jgi:hypothetical protein